MDRKGIEPLILACNVPVSTNGPLVSLPHYVTQVFEYLSTQETLLIHQQN